VIPKVTASEKGKAQTRNPRDETVRLYGFNGIELVSLEL